MKTAKAVMAEIAAMKKQMDRDGSDSWTRGYLAALVWVADKKV